MFFFFFFKKRHNVLELIIPLNKKNVELIKSVDFTIFIKTHKKIVVTFVSFFFLFFFWIIFFFLNLRNKNSIPILIDNSNYQVRVLQWVFSGNNPKAHLMEFIVANKVKDSSTGHINFIQIYVIDLNFVYTF